jgi:succinate-semialdehyde dehydrogenase/glutarate-semialdehyde dehydrogenase
MNTKGSGNRMVRQYIGGKMEDGWGKPMPVRNPATGEVIDIVGAATAAQAVEALEAAQRAFKTWSKTSITERVSWLLRLRDACLAEREKILDVLSAESGRPYISACQDFDWMITSFTFYSEEIKRVYGTSFPDFDTQPGTAYHVVERRPIGVVVSHVAWNYPLGNAGLKIAPSVVSGCTCVLKPSSQTPLATLRVAEIAEKIGFPAGVFNVVAGPSEEIGYALNSSTIPKMITLIGSSETGRRIMKDGAASIKKYSMELGGNAPVIVMGDVDVDKVAKAIVAKKVGNAGQTCVCYNRIYIHESIYGEMCERIIEHMKEVKIGMGRDPGFVMGPLINREARDKMIELIEDAVRGGAKLAAGGEIPKGYEAGNYLTPALLVDVNDTMRVSKEEIFGPIIPVQSFSNLDDALVKANNTVYGLSAYFYGHNAREICKAFEALEAGEIFVNGCGGGSQLPHAGCKQSGVGCDSSHWSLEEYLDFHRISMIP